MTAPKTKYPSQGRGWLTIGVPAILVVTALLYWAATRQTAADKEIQQRLAALHAAGTPIDAPDLARAFPNPPAEADAQERLQNVLLFANAHDAPRSALDILTNSLPIRIAPLPDSIVGDLRQYRQATQSAFDSWPAPWPPGMRFASHWERGLPDFTIPHVVHVRKLTYMIATRALLAAEEGDAAGTSLMLVRGFQFAQSIPHDTEICQAVGVSHSDYLLMVAECCLNRVILTDAQLAELTAALPLQETNHMLEALRGEDARSIQLFEKVRKSPSGIFSGRATEESWWRYLMRRTRRSKPEYRAPDFVAFLTLCPQAEKFIAQPPMQAMTNLNVLMNTYHASARSLAGRMVPTNWPKLLRVSYETESKMAALRTVLAVERYRQANAGKLPERLDELVPTYLNAVPRDPFDGQSLRFKKLPQGYVIYSVGSDGVDDGGQEKSVSQTKGDVTITITH